MSEIVVPNLKAKAGIPQDTPVSVAETAKRVTVRWVDRHGKREAIVERTEGWLDRLIAKMRDGWED